ncbi:MAG: dihydrofolate reductase [Thiohalomonadales bacterium]
MSISIILAMSQNNVIGINNSLPWKLPADMRWFRKNTLGKTILMGRKTFESFGAKALPERRNLIVSSAVDYKAQGAEVFSSLTSAFAAVSEDDELMVMGGSTIYQQCLPLCQTIYLTTVHANIDGDAYFPTIDKSSWIERYSEHCETDERHAYRYSFFILDRKP